MLGAVNGLAGAPPKRFSLKKKGVHSGQTAIPSADDAPGPAKKANFNARGMFTKAAKNAFKKPAPLLAIVNSMKGAASADGSSLLPLDPVGQKDDWFPDRLYLIDAMNRRRRDKLIPHLVVPPKPLTAEEEIANLAGKADWVNENERKWLEDEFLKKLTEKNNLESNRLQVLRVYRRQFYEEIFGRGLGNSWLYEEENIRQRGLDDAEQADGPISEYCIDMFLWACAMGEIDAVQQILLKLVNPMEAAMLGAALCKNLIDDDGRDSAFAPSIRTKGQLEDIVDVLNEKAVNMLQFFIKKNDKLTFSMLQTLKVGKKAQALSFIVKYDDFERHHDYLDLAKMAGNSNFLSTVLEDSDGTGERWHERWFGQGIRLRSTFVFLMLMPLLPVLPMWPLKSIVFKSDEASKGCTRNYTDRLISFMRAPVFYFLFDCLCYIGLVMSQTYITIIKASEPPNGSSAYAVLQHLSIAEWVFLAFGAVHVINQFFEMGMPADGNRLSITGYARQAKKWCQDLWNVMDVVIVGLGILAYTLRLRNEEVWWRILMSLGLWVSWLRLLEYVASVSPTLGAMVNGLFAMGKDVLNFLIVLLFVMFGFGFCSYALMHPHGRSDDEEGYDMLYFVFIKPSWQMLGELFLEDYDDPYDVTCDHAYDFAHLSAEGFRLQPGLEKCLTKNIATVVLICYAMITSVVLVNLLVAMMGSRWEQDSSSQKAKFASNFFNMVDRYELYPPPVVELFMLPVKLLLKGSDVAGDAGLAAAKGAKGAVAKIGGEMFSSDPGAVEAGVLEAALDDKEDQQTRTLTYFVEEVKELFMKNDGVRDDAAGEQVSDLVMRMEDLETKLGDVAKGVQAQVGSLEKHILLLLKKQDCVGVDSGEGVGAGAGEGMRSTQQEHMEQRIAEALKGTVQTLAAQMAAGMLAGAEGVESGKQEDEGIQDKEEDADEEEEEEEEEESNAAAGQNADAGARGGQLSPSALSFGPYAPSPIKGTQQAKPEPRQRISPVGELAPIAAGSLMDSLSNVVATAPASANRGSQSTPTSEQPPLPPTPAEQIEAARARGHLRLLFASPEFRDMV
jgi:hypothetical protein